jgi:hypothetical protein
MTAPTDTAAARRYALTTTCQLSSGRVEVAHVETTDYQPHQWRRLLDSAADGATSRYDSDPVATVSVQVQTVKPDGTVQLRPVQWCDACAQFKVPGARHRHDPRRAPAVGVVLSYDCTLQRWTDRDGDDWQDRMFSASRDDARWLAVPRSYTVRVVALGHEEAWSGDDDYPARTSVEFVCTRSGDWTDHDDNDDDRHGYLLPGAGSCHDLGEWRSMADGMDVVAG